MNMEYLPFIFALVFILIADVIAVVITKKSLAEIKRIKGKADEIVAGAIDAGADCDSVSGCAFGAVRHTLSGRHYSFGVCCLIAASPTHLYFVMIDHMGNHIGKPDKSEQVICFEHIEKLEIKKNTKWYKVRLRANGKNSSFVIHKLSPYDIIPRQSENALKIIEMLRVTVEINEANAA